MRLSLLFAAVLFTSPALAAAPADVVTSFHGALASGDLDRALSLLSPNATVFESGYVERSRGEYAGHHMPADSAFAKATKRKVLQHAERIDGNLAVVMNETETTGRFKDKAVHLLGTETAMLEKTDDQWLIVHVHWSSRKVGAK